MRAPKHEEPSATIYGPDWHAAQEQLLMVREARLRVVLRGAFKHLERGWKTLRPVQLHHEHNGPPFSDDVTTAVLYFLEVEIVDRYRGLALEIAGAVPKGRGVRVSTAGFDDMQSEMELMRLYFRLAGLMGESAAVDQPARGFAAGVGRLVPWARDFERRFEELETTLRELGLSDEDE